jgi:Ca-activated chloride channel homolog
VKFGLKDKKTLQSDVVLKRVSINGYVCGDYVEFTMSHLYENKSGNYIDAVYTFPIPDTAVITGFEAILGGRTLKAVVEDRTEAARIYDEALEQGINSFSLERYEDNVFQINIGNILPGETVKIKISYMDQIIYEDNNYKLIIPAVVSPQYVPEAALKKGISEEEIFESLESDDYKLYMNLLIESMGRLEFSSPTHEIRVEREDDTLSKINFKHSDEYLDSDFIILFKETAAEEASGMAYKYTDSEGEKGILYLKLFPRLELEYEDEPQNYCFLVDVSRSMKDQKLEEAKNALQLCIRNLSEEDTFNIIAFDSSIHSFSADGKVRLTEQNLRSATEWIDNLKPQKGANIYEALKYALMEKNQVGNSTILLFTDDEVEKENEILEYIEQNISDNRIFPVGIDTSVNSYFINKLASIGGGKAEFIYPGERIDEMILRQFNRINNPQIDVVDLDWGNMKVDLTYPRTIEYLYDREPVSIFARVSGDISGNVTIKGRVKDREYIKTINLDDIDLEENANLIQKVWTRKRIESIQERLRMERGSIAQSMKNKIVELSKESGLISSETSFVLLEVIEDPVLGMPINNILPLYVSEEAAKDISEAYFLDAPTFFYSSDLREKMAEEKVDETTAKNILRYDRENILRTIAKNQFVDGAFANIDESDSYNRIETTLLALLAFTLGSEDINIYINQLNKAVKFSIDMYESQPNLFDEKLSSLGLIALKTSLSKDMLKGKIKEEAEMVLNKIRNVIENRKYIAVLNVADTGNLDVIKQFTVAVLGISKSFIQGEESIFSRDEKTSITDLALLAISKTL